MLIPDWEEGGGEGGQQQQRGRGEQQGGQRGVPGGRLGAGGGRAGDRGEQVLGARGQLVSRYTVQGTCHLEECARHHEQVEGKGQSEALQQQVEEHEFIPS